MEGTKINYYSICENVCETNDQVENSIDSSPTLCIATKDFQGKVLKLKDNFDRRYLEVAINEIEQAGYSALKIAYSTNAPKPLKEKIKYAQDQVIKFKLACLT